jgi:hypothetical protein
MSRTNEGYKPAPPTNIGNRGINPLRSTNPQSPKAVINPGLARVLQFRRPAAASSRRIGH